MEGRVTHSDHGAPFKDNSGSKCKLQTTGLLLFIVLKGLTVPRKQHNLLHSIELKFIFTTKQKPVAS